MQVITVLATNKKTPPAKKARRKTSLSQRVREQLLLLDSGAKARMKGVFVADTGTFHTSMVLLIFVVCTLRQ